MSVIPLPDVINMLTCFHHTKENSNISLIDILNEYASGETIRWSELSIFDTFKTKFDMHETKYVQF